MAPAGSRGGASTQFQYAFQAVAAAGSRLIFQQGRGGQNDGVVVRNLNLKPIRNKIYYNNNNNNINNTIIMSALFKKVCDFNKQLEVKQLLNPSLEDEKFIDSRRRRMV